MTDVTLERLGRIQELRGGTALGNVYEGGNRVDCREGREEGNRWRMSRKSGVEFTVQGFLRKGLYVIFYIEETGEDLGSKGMYLE